MRSVVAQKLQVAKFAEPIIVIDHNGIGWSFAEGQKIIKDSPNAVHVGIDLFVGQERSAFILVGRVADLGRAATHQDDRLVPAFLQVALHHDLDQMADVQARSCTIIAYIGSDNSLHQRCVQRFHVCALVNEPPFFEGIQEF